MISDSEVACLVWSPCKEPSDAANIQISEKPLVEMELSCRHVMFLIKGTSTPVEI